MQNHDKKYISDNPILLTEWDYERNETLGLSPETTTQKS
jgi:hypothetical protein